MLVTFGFTDVYVLNGGLLAWKREGGALEQGMPSPVLLSPETLSPPDPRRVAGFRDVQRAIASGQVLLDARSSARFHGDAAEPVAGVPSGNIEGSTNLPYQDLLDEAGGGFAPTDALHARFERAGVDMRAPVVCSCGSGVTACVVALALETLGHPCVAVYDGSWTDWTQKNFQGAVS